VLFSLGGFVLLYSSLLVVDVFLMRKYVLMGPVLALGHAPSAPSGNVSPAPHPAE